MEDSNKADPPPTEGSADGESKEQKQDQPLTDPIPIEAPPTDVPAKPKANGDPAAATGGDDPYSKDGPLLGDQDAPLSKRRGTAPSYDHKGHRLRKLSEPPLKSSPLRKVSIIKPPSTNLDPPNEDGPGGKPLDGIIRSRKFSEGALPHSPRQRKISFITTDSLMPPRDGSLQCSRDKDLTDHGGGVDPSPLSSRVYLENDEDDSSDTWWRNEEDKRESLPFLQIVQGGRFTPRPSCASLAMRGSRASFATQGGVSMSPNLTSRPSMVSLKETLSRVNLELHPEKGSFVAFSMGQSMASIPTIAAKVYIITQVLAAISVSMGSMAVGFTAGWTSPALASMQEANSTLNITAEQESWVGSLMPLSALTGSILGGYLVDAIGRKMLICLCGPPFIVAYILLGAATNVWMLYIGRCIAGMCVGFLTLTLPVYLSETIQAEIRGTLGLLPTTLGNGGILLCFLTGAYVNWSVLSYIGAVIPAVFLIMMIFVPETPRWYVSKEREEDAYRSLCWLRGTNADVDMELQDILLNHEMSATESSSLRDVFTRRYFKPFAIAMTLMSFQQLSGINAVIFYSVSIFNSVGSSLDSNLCSIIVGIVNLLSTFLATAMIDRLGRKILLYISNVLMVVSLIGLASFFYLKSLSETEVSWQPTVESITWIPLVSLILYVLGFSLGWGPIPWLFMGEALPAKIRGPAASMVTAFNWACTFVITKLFPSMLANLGEAGVFSMFAVIMMLGTVFSIFCVPETKGMSLEDIEAKMMGRTKPSVNRKLSEMSGIVMT